MDGVVKVNSSADYILNNQKKKLEITLFIK
jgi:hypothetical protein